MRFGQRFWPQIKISEYANSPISPAPELGGPGEAWQAWRPLLHFFQAVMRAETEAGAVRIWSNSAETDSLPLREARGNANLDDRGGVSQTAAVKRNALRSLGHVGWE